MRVTLKWAGRVAAVMVLLVVALLATVYAMSETRMRRTWQVGVSVPSVPSGAAAVDRGEHLATIRGCRGCHAPDMGGATFIDSPPMAKLSGTNLTPGRGGVRLDDEALVRAIRHGVGPGGRSLLFMPSQEFSALSEADMGDLLAYLHGLPPVDRQLPPNRVGPLGRLLFLAGKVPLLPAEVVDHDTRPAQPQPGPTVAYGDYLASACKGCHGAGLSGGAHPGDAAGLAGCGQPDTRSERSGGVERGRSAPRVA